jgi:hypothetical protein
MMMLRMNLVVRKRMEWFVRKGDKEVQRDKGYHKGIKED